MPYQRQDSPYYYLELTLSDGRTLVRSTRATSKRRARAIEATVREMDTTGRHEVLDALCEGRITPRQLHSAKLAGRVKALMHELDDPPLAEALEAFLRHETSERIGEGLGALRRYAPSAARVSWLTDPDNLREFLTWMREEMGYAAGTEKLYMAHLSKFMRRTLGNEVRDQVYDQLDLRRVNNERCVWLTQEELAAVREIASPRMWTAVAVTVGTGLRLGELIALLVRDVDREQKVVRVRRGKSPAARRVVPVEGEPLRVVDVHINREGLSARDPLFPGWKDYHIYNRWKRYRDTLGLTTENGDPVRWHDLRHHYAVYMARSGMPLTELRDRLGHRSLDMTERYALYQPPEARERYRSALGEMGLAGGAAKP